MTEVKRSSDRFKGHTKTTYKTALFSVDDGMWTVIEVTEKPILMAPSRHEAEAIVKRMGGVLVQ